MKPHSTLSLRLDSSYLCDYLKQDLEKIAYYISPILVARFLTGNALSKDMTSDDDDMILSNTGNLNWKPLVRFLIKFSLVYIISLMVTLFISALVFGELTNPSDPRYVVLGLFFLLLFGFLFKYVAFRGEDW